MVLTVTKMYLQSRMLLSFMACIRAIKKSTTENMVYAKQTHVLAYASVPCLLVSNISLLQNPGFLQKMPLSTTVSSEKIKINLLKQLKVKMGIKELI